MFAGTRWLWTMEEMVIIRRRGSWQSVREWATLLWPIFLSFLLRDKTYGARFSNYVVTPCSYVWELRWNWTFENHEMPPFPIFNEILMMTLFGFVNPNCKIKTSLCTKTKHDRIPWVWAHCRAGISPPQAPTRLGQTKQGPATRVDSRTTLFIL